MSFECEVDEARPGDIDLGDNGVATQFVGNGFGQFARLLAGIFRQHHGGIGRHVAMAGSLDQQRTSPRQHRPAVRRRADAGEHVGKEVSGFGGGRHNGCA